MARLLLYLLESVESRTTTARSVVAKTDGKGAEFPAQ